MLRVRERTRKRRTGRVGQTRPTWSERLMSVGDRFAYAPASDSSRRFGIGVAVSCAGVNLRAFVGPWLAMRAPRVLVRDGWIRHSAPLLASTRPIAFVALMAAIAVGALTHTWRSISAWSPW